MTVHWSRLPGIVPTAPRKPRQPVMRGTWQCVGVQGCGELLVGTWAAAERHSDTHHGSRLAQVFEQSDNLHDTSTEGEPE